MFEVGDFVRYKMKNELGLVKTVYADKIRCWWHIGGTAALGRNDLFEKLTLEQVLNEEFKNEYAKKSLLERKLRLKESGDVSDLIDERHIRENIEGLVK